MIPSPFFEITSLITETALKFSPVFIKWIDTDVNTVILVQVIVKLVIALCLVTQKEISEITEITPKNVFLYSAFGILGFMSTNVRYSSYKELPVSLTLFIKSLKPVFLVVILALVGFEQPIYYLPIFIITFLALLYTLRPLTQDIEQFKNIDKKDLDIKYKAICALLFLSLIGCVGPILRRYNYITYETNLIRTNIFALISSIGYFIYTKKIPDLRIDVLVKLTLYTIILGYFVSKFHANASISVPEIYYAGIVFVGIIISNAINDKFFKKKITV
jgi:uncharacterized membrane protein